MQARWPKAWCTSSGTRRCVVGAALEVRQVVVERFERTQQLAALRAAFED
jgi:hypothetical protein